MTDHATPRPSSHPIVVGLDDTASAGRALRWTIDRCLETGAGMLAVHVLTYTAEFRRDLSLATMTNWRRTLEAQLARDWTDPARDAGVLVSTQVVEADSVAAGLLSASETAGADLVVLGAHDRGGLVDRLAGSTSYAVSHRAHTPVVIVPAAWEPSVA